MKNMKIIVPPHKKISEPVKSWKEIKNDAKEMVKSIRSDEFANKVWANAYAVSHSQVSEDPKMFFVVNRKMHGIKQKIKNDVIVNPVIIDKDEVVFNREGCMSKPFHGTKKISRYLNIVVKYKVPFLWFLRSKKSSFRGLPAFVFQHEIDHFKGKYL